MPDSGRGTSRRDSVYERQQSLLVWITDRPQHEGLTASEIVDVSGIYDDLQGRYDKCLVDLKRLAHEGYLFRNGRPARWTTD